jgi:hypothetical protein
VSGIDGACGLSSSREVRSEDVSGGGGRGKSSGNGRTAWGHGRTTIRLQKSMEELDNSIFSRQKNRRRSKDRG